MVIKINSVIGRLSWVHLKWVADTTVWLQVSDYGQMSDYNPTQVKNKAVNTPIKFEEIVYGYDKSSNKVISNHSTSLS